MILILTSKLCATTDILLNYLKGYDVFRFNIDMWRNYSWSITPDGYRLEDPTGRVCEESQVGVVYHRKLFFNPESIDIPAGGNEESWCRTEVEAIWQGIKDLAQASGKLALVHPSPSGAWNKMRQMRIAAKYFPVPDWQMLHKATPSITGEAVCKTNGAKGMGEGRFLMVNKVDVKTLHPDYPWFIQKAVRATHDVTVVYVNGHLFAYQYDRSQFPHTMDCRRATFELIGDWLPYELSKKDAAGIRALMAETGYSYSRLDFLLTAEGLVFLELNKNGQYAWLDLYGKNGLLEAVAGEIKRVHDRNMKMALRQA